jgi:two-component system sensor histidine kinase SenX3
VRVRDTGTGIPATELSKIFTKFYRASTAVKGKRRGTGIGLAFVKAVVDGQGGNVSVTSTVGTGSTFIVEFPSADPPERKNRT